MHRDTDGCIAITSLDGNVAPGMLLEPLPTVLVILGSCDPGRFGLCARRPFGHTAPCLEPGVTPIHRSKNLERFSEWKHGCERVAHPGEEVGKLG